MGEPSYAAEVAPKKFTKGVEFEQPITLPPATDGQVRATPEGDYIFQFTEDANTDRDIVVEDACEVVDIVARKRNGAGAGNTVQAKKGAAAISDTIACAVDNAVTRAASIDDANATLDAGDTLRVSLAFAAGTGDCVVIVRTLRR